MKLYTYQDGELVSVQELPYSESREPMEHFNAQGVKFEVNSVYVASSGHETFRIVGDVEDVVYVCCPEAPMRFTKCVTYTAPGIDLDAAANDPGVLAQVKAQVVQELFSLVESMKPAEEDGPNRCPLHNSKPEPKLLDFLIKDAFSPESIAEVISNENP